MWAARGRPARPPSLTSTLVRRSYLPATVANVRQRMTSAQHHTPLSHCRTREASLERTHCSVLLAASTQRPLLPVQLFLEPGTLAVLYVHGQFPVSTKFPSFTKFPPSFQFPSIFQFPARSFLGSFLSTKREETTEFPSYLSPYFTRDSGSM